MWDNQFTCWPSWFRSSGKTALVGNLENWSKAMWTISGPSEAYSMKTTRRFCFMRTELNLCECRPFHNLCFQDLDKLYNINIRNGWNMLKPQFNDVTCNDHLLLVSFNVIPDILATVFSYQPRPSPGDPRGPKARPLGTPSLVQTGRKKSPEMWFFHVFPGTSPEKCLTFKDV